MRKILFIFLSLFILSCDKGEEPELGFDLESWKKDKNACENFRSQHVNELIDNSSIFLGWPERQINSFFGRPDRHRLSKRHQKFYVYFLHAGKQCDSTLNEYGNFLQFRIDATGYVNEIEVRNDFEQLTD